MLQIKMLNFNGAKFILVLFWSFLESLQRTASTEVREYCPSEYFNVTCSHPNDVILMEHAQYGRMQTGRCVTTKTGCSVDVLDFFDRRCSARRQCTVYVSDPLLHQRAPCDKDFTSYLEAKYKCITTGGGSIAGCRDGHVTLTGKTVGYVVSTSDPNYGLSSSAARPRCPWKIEGGPGQTIRLSVMWFGGIGDGGDNKMAAAGRSTCNKISLGELRDGGSNRATTFSTSCSDSGRERIVYVSTGSYVTLQLKSVDELNGLAPFIVKYEVLGCQQVKPPAGGYVKIDSSTNTASVHCNGTKETWYLTCTGNKWTGHMGNCTDKATAKSEGVLGLSLVEDNFPYGILLVVAIGVALGVLIGGVLLSCVAYYMKRQNRFHGYAEPTEWTKQMLESEMEAYNESKQHNTTDTHTRYIQDGPNTVATPGPRPINSSAATAVGYVRGCSCPNTDDTMSYQPGHDCCLVVPADGAVDAGGMQPRLLYEIPQFNS